MLLHLRTSTPMESALLDLPDELFLNITDHLDVVDLACLSLCNHDLDLKFGRSRGSQILKDVGARQDLLVRFARDHSALFFCYDCVRLHHMSGVPPPALTGMKPPYGSLKCVVHPTIRGRPLPYSCRVRPTHIHGPFSAYCIAFQHIQLAADILSPTHQALLQNLATVEVQDRDGETLGSFPRTTLLSVEPRMMHGEVYLRIQQWARFCGGNLSPGKFMWNMAACAHIDPSKYYDSSLFKALDCDIFHRNQCCGACHRLLKCMFCPTEYRFEVKNLHHRGDKALVLTKWPNLGRGDDPSTPSWRWHLYRWDQSKPNSSADLLAHPADEQNGTCASFERLPGEALLEITRRNRKLLDRDVYRKLLKRHPASNSRCMIYARDVPPPQSTCKVVMASFSMLACLLLLLSIFTKLKSASNSHAIHPEPPRYTPVYMADYYVTIFETTSRCCWYRVENREHTSPYGLKAQPLPGAFYNIANRGSCEHYDMIPVWRK